MPPYSLKLEGAYYNISIFETIKTVSYEYRSSYIQDTFTYDTYDKIIKLLSKSP